MPKRLKLLYYGLIANLPVEGLEYEGDLSFLPFSSSEPPYHQTEKDGTIKFLDWMAILESVEEEEDETSSSQ